MVLSLNGVLLLRRYICGSLSGGYITSPSEILIARHDALPRTNVFFILKPFSYKKSAQAVKVMRAFFMHKYRSIAQHTNNGRVPMQQAL